MSQQMNLQDAFLNQARKQNITVTVFLTNGFQFKGTVTGFDNFTIVLNNEGRQNIVYKHAVSTIVPFQRVQLLENSTMNV